jgi:hypothetical protein
MANRVHAYLDGEIPFEALTPSERADAEAYLEVLEGVVPHVRERVGADLTGDVMRRIHCDSSSTRADGVAGGSARDMSDPDMSDRDASDRTIEAIRTRAERDEVEVIRTSNGSGVSAGVRWLWTPMAVRVRPAWGLMGAAAGLMWLLLPGEGPHEIRGGGGTGDQTPVGVGAPALVQADDPPPAVLVFVQFRLDAPDASEVALAGSFTGWEPRHPLHRGSDGSWSVLVPLAPGIHDYGFVVDGTRWVVDPSAPRTQDGFGGENSRLAVLAMNTERDS